MATTHRCHKTRPMSTRIVADTLIPGRGTPVDDGTVIMEFGEISYVGPTTDAPPAVGDEDLVEVDTVLPGLWDCHAHFVGLPMTNLEAMGSADIVAASARAVDDAQQCVNAGVTSVREVGGIGIRLAQAITEGRDARSASSR